MSEEKKSSNLPDPGATTPGKAPESSARPASPAIPAAPAKHFPRAAEVPVTRGPGRPPKHPAQRGGAPAQAGAFRAPGAAAASSASSPGDRERSPIATAKPPEDLSAKSVARGLLSMIAGVEGTIASFTLKIPMIQAMAIAAFSEAELARLEKSGGQVIEKYAPMLENYGPEIEFTGTLLQIQMAKIFALMAARQALEAAKSSQPAAGSAPKPAPVTTIRPAAAPAPKEAAAAKPDQPAPAKQAETTAQAASAGAPPSAFEHQDLDRGAELITL